MALENYNNKKDNKDNTINYNTISTYRLHLRLRQTIQRHVHIIPVPSAPAARGCERSTPAAEPPTRIRLQGGGLSTAIQRKFSYGTRYEFLCVPR